MTRCQVLVVAPTDWSTEPLSRWNHYLIAFRFVEKFPTDGLSAWRTNVTREGETIEVAADCYSYNGGFAQHALNRFYSQALLRLRPKLVLIVGLAGCTVDLIRVADLLDTPVVLLLDKPAEPIDSLSTSAWIWLRSSLGVCKYIVSGTTPIDENWAGLLPNPLMGISSLESIVDGLLAQSQLHAQYDYSLYEFCQRDHPLLLRMQRGDTKHFSECTNVLDVACGVGIFLDCLRQEGIAAEGVERDSRVAKYAMGMGLSVTVGDAQDFLDQSAIEFDGIYCSHFIEHLPVEAVQRILQLMANRLAQGGVLVLVFPDPESIRSQLLGFWRDPEHVRFYHPELIALMAATVGFELEWSSYSEQPHRVVPFSPAPPSPVPRIAPPNLSIERPVSTGGVFERLLQTLGLATESRLRRLEAQLMGWSRELLDYSRQSIQADMLLEERTTTLWDINQTWCWNDNVTLKFRKSIE